MRAIVVLKSMDVEGSSRDDQGNSTVETIAHFEIQSDLGVHQVSVAASGHHLDSAAASARNRLGAWAAGVQRGAQQE